MASIGPATFSPLPHTCREQDYSYCCSTHFFFTGTPTCKLNKAREIYRYCMTDLTEGNHIEHDHLIHGSSPDNVALDSRTVGNRLVGVDAPGWFFAVEQILQEFLDL